MSFRDSFDAWLGLLIRNMAILRFIAMLGAMIVISVKHGLEIWAILHELAQHTSNQQQQILNIVSQDNIMDHVLILMGMAALTLQKLSLKLPGSDVQIGNGDKS